MVMPYLRAIAVIVILFLFDNSSSQPHREIQCRDPDVGGTTQNKNRKFILFGADSSQGAGIGNLLIFFPAVYYFAAFSGRDIILGDSSIVGAYSTIVAAVLVVVNTTAIITITIIIVIIITATTKSVIIITAIVITLILWYLGL